jgi:hypothetical protein
MKALGVGNAWLFEAEKAVDIIRKYGEGVTHPSQPVIDKVVFMAMEPKGSTKLLAWLKNWKTMHPI